MINNINGKFSVRWKHHHRRLRKKHLVRHSTHVDVHDDSLTWLTPRQNQLLGSGTGNRSQGRSQNPLTRDTEVYRTNLRKDLDHSHFCN